LIDGRFTNLTTASEARNIEVIDELVKFKNLTQEKLE
jgi:hypothetical protein